MDTVAAHFRVAAGSPDVGGDAAAMQDTIAVSYALCGALARRHLDQPFGAVIRPLPPERAPRTEPPAFMRLTQVGKPLAGMTGDALSALQNVLTACHAPGRFTLIFLLASDGMSNSVYLGAQSHDGDPAKVFLRGVANFLEANWPGTQFTACLPDDEIFGREVAAPLREFEYVAAMTGVPSLRPGERSGYPQTLDRLLNGMRGRRFLYAAIAEPMRPEDVDDIVHRSRDLMGEVHALIKTALTRSSTVQETEGGSHSTEVSYGTSVQKGTTRGHTYDETSWWQSCLENLQIASEVQRSSSETETRSDARTETETKMRGGAWSSALSSGENIGREMLNAHAMAVETQLQDYVRRFEQSRALGCWDVGVYLFAEREDLIQQGAMQIKALLSGEKSLYEPIRMHELHRFWVTDIKEALCEFRQPTLALIRPEARGRGTELTHADRLEHLLGAHFSGLTTPLNTEELALLTNLPQREIAGIPVIATAAFSLNVPRPRAGDVVLGSLLEGSKPTPFCYPIPLRTLAKHTLVTGVTGSGKSTTCLRLLDELRRRDHPVPFLVIEPTKAEYVEWALRVNATLPEDSPRRIRVYMPGVASWRGHPLEDQLFLNPLDIVWICDRHPVSVLSHVDQFKWILNASCPMEEALPILLEDVLFAVYAKPFNWLGDEPPPYNSPRPTLSQMYDAVRDVVRQKGYEDRVNANLPTALMTRIQSLRRGWKGQLFDRPRSTPWEEIFDQRVIINLSQLGDDAAFAMGVLLQFLYEYRRAQFETDPPTADGSQPLRHLTALEEAHRILLRTPPGVAGQANLQRKVAEMFSDMLSEIRGYGEGFLIVDQMPARLVPDAVKNTNLKIVHQLVASDDRDAVSGCMTLTPEQAALINRLRVGHAIVYGDQDDMSAWVQVALTGEPGPV